MAQAISLLMIRINFYKNLKNSAFIHIFLNHAMSLLFTPVPNNYLDTIKLINHN